MNQKLGNKIDAMATITYNPFSWMNVNTSLILADVGQTKYSEVEDSNVRSNLEADTATESRWLRVGMGLSTLEAYKRKKFEVPLEVGVSAQRLLNAKNTANYDRVDFDFKFYF